jgi:hypothetical protein
MSLMKTARSLLHLVSGKGDLVPGEVDAVNEVLSKITGIALSFLYQADRAWSERLQDWVYATPIHVHKKDLKRYTELQRKNDIPTPPASPPCSCGHVEPPAPQPTPLTRSHRAALSEAWSRELRTLVKQREKASEVRVSVDPEFEPWE